MHPKDMQVRGLQAGQLVRVSSTHGQLLLPVAEAADVLPGSVFTPMHWGAQSMQGHGINAVLGDAVCPQSQQPELKHVPVRIEAVQLPWRCMVALHAVGTEDVALALRARLQALLPAVDYASLTWLGDGALLLKAAHAHSPVDWLQSLLAACDLPALGGSDAHTISYWDARKGQGKSVAWHSDAAGTPYLRALVFAGSAGDAAGGEHLLTPLAEQTVWTGSRLAALNPQAAQNGAAGVKGASRDKVLCNCKGVKVSQVQALRQQGKDMAAIQAELGCGTVCGSCVPELKGLCAA
jgi:assimilatory nitrate reductase catalytic subunit